jgi:formylglycine-generating enzyme required for sulfatase activity
MVTVGDPGNANDTTGYGSVGYSYQIGTYEVTIGQYSDFLNAVAASDPNGLYFPNMQSDQSTAGIARSGASGSYAYVAIGPSGTTPAGASSPGGRPISYVNWFNAARFANWLSNGQPTGPQGPTTTENGAYDLSFWFLGIAPAVNATNPNTGAAPLYRLPTENEWYKPAYYKGGGTDAGYWDYATQSDATPGNMIGGAANQANYALGGVFFSVPQSASFGQDQNLLTDVGAFSSSPSGYHTFDQSGNVYEWNDLDGSVGFTRGLRGGNFASDETTIAATARGALDPLQPLGGFRLVSPLNSPVTIPEIDPHGLSAALGLIVGGLGILERRQRGLPDRNCPGC